MQFFVLKYFAIVFFVIFSFKEDLRYDFYSNELEVAVKILFSTN